MSDSYIVKENEDIKRIKVEDEDDENTEYSYYVRYLMERGIKLDETRTIWNRWAKFEFENHLEKMIILHPTIHKDNIAAYILDAAKIEFDYELDESEWDDKLKLPTDHPLAIQAGLEKSERDE